MMAPVPVKVPTGPLKLDSGSGWQVGGPKGFASTVSSSNRSGGHTPREPSSPKGVPNDRSGATLQPEAASKVAGASPLPPPSGPPPGQAAPISLNSADQSTRGGYDSSLPGAVQDSG